MQCWPLSLLDAWASHLSSPERAAELPWSRGVCWIPPPPELPSEEQWPSCTLNSGELVLNAYSSGESASAWRPAILHAPPMGRVEVPALEWSGCSSVPGLHTKISTEFAVPLGLPCWGREKAAVGSKAVLLRSVIAELSTMGPSCICCRAVVFHVVLTVVSAFVILCLHLWQ